MVSGLPVKKTVAKTITAVMTTATNPLLSSGSVEAREAELTPPLTQVTALAPAVPSAVMAPVATRVPAHTKRPLRSARVV